MAVIRLRSLGDCVLVTPALEILKRARPDLQVAVEGALLAKMRNTGQSCIAGNRLLVQRPIYEQFLDIFVTRVRSLKVGEYSEPGVEIGPLID